MCGTVTYGEAPSYAADLQFGDIALLGATGARLASGIASAGAELIDLARGLLGAGEPVIQQLGIAGLWASADEM